MYCAIDSNDRACARQYSKCCSLTSSAGMLGSWRHVSRSATSRCDSRYASGFRRTPSTIENTAVAAPIVSVSVRTEMPEYRGSRTRPRSTSRRSNSMLVILTYAGAVWLFVSQRVNRIEARRFERRQEPADHADHGQNRRGDDHELSRQDKVDVGHAAGIVEQLGQKRTRAQRGHQTVRDGDADDAAHEGRRKPFEQELNQDFPPARAERLPDPDLARALLDVDEHDVHDADAADRQRQHADEGQDDRQACDDAARDLVRLLGAEHMQRPLVGRVVAVALGQELAHFTRRPRLHRRRYGLPDECADVAVVAQSAHRRPWNEDAVLVRPVVVGELDLLFHHADDLERLAADADRLTDSRRGTEQLP